MALLCCAVLCCAVLCCAVLPCAVLCCPASNAQATCFALEQHAESHLGCAETCRTESDLHCQAVLTPWFLMPTKQRWLSVLVTMQDRCLLFCQVHLRHVVGGRARGSQEMPDEKLYSVSIPERRGALKQLLRALSPAWNVTLLHYRKTGKHGCTQCVTC